MDNNAPVTRLLDDDDRFIIHRTGEAARELIVHWHQKRSTLTVAQEAAGSLFVHCTSCWRGICKLLDNCDDVDEIEMLSNSAACILRALHDAAIQLEYILSGDLKRGHAPDQLGQLYLDFEFVERYKSASRIDEFKSALANHIASSPMRADGEPLLRKDYERVKESYPSKNHWYAGSLADIAAVIGRKEEYFWLLSQYNSAVHGGPSAVLQGPTPAGADIYLIAMNILVRVGRLLNNQLQSQLSSSAIEVFATESDLLNLAPDARGHKDTDSP